MKKKIKYFSILYFFLVLTCFASDLELSKDFQLFNTALSLSTPESYDSSVDILTDLKTAYPSSILVTNGIIDFNIGKILFKQKKYKESIKAFEASKLDSAEKNYYIADAYYNLKDDKAFDIFKSIYDNSKDLRYTVLALNKLANYDYYYSYLYDIKYTKDFSNIWELDTKDLEKIGDYFLNAKDLKSANIIFKQVLNRKSNQLLEAKYLFSKEEFENAIDILEKLNSEESKNLRVEIYDYEKNKNKMKLSMVAVIKDHPESHLAAKYRYKLYEEEKNDNYLKWIIIYNSDSPQYDDALKIYGKDYISKFSEKEEKYKDLIQKLEYLKSLNLNSLCLAEIKSKITEESDKLYKDYLLAVYK